ncbi:MAG TPA: hypothetical protein VFN79_11285 [Steroidobacteraceae bacterium]|nr:hypothetical protein [Steroidobacteraceae bacterium]
MKEAARSVRAQCPADAISRRRHRWNVVSFGLWNIDEVMRQSARNAQREGRHQPASGEVVGHDPALTERDACPATARKKGELAPRCL